METNKQKLKLEEMDKISGGSDSGFYNGMPFYELDGPSQHCVRAGYCPKCNPQMEGMAWNQFSKGYNSYDCKACGLKIATM
jgi:hypothetical protein